VAAGCPSGQLADEAEQQVDREQQRERRLARDAGGQPLVYDEHMERICTIQQNVCHQRTGRGHDLTVSQRRERATTSVDRGPGRQARPSMSAAAT
jgi:hypothetical protein